MMASSWLMVLGFFQGGGGCGFLGFGGGWVSIWFWGGGQAADDDGQLLVVGMVWVCVCVCV